MNENEHMTDWDRPSIDAISTRRLLRCVDADEFVYMCAVLESINTMQDVVVHKWWWWESKREIQYEQRRHII